MDLSALKGVIITGINALFVGFTALGLDANDGSANGAKGSKAN